VGAGVGELRVDDGRGCERGELGKEVDD